LRSFIAINLPDRICDQVERVQSRMRAGRMVPRANLHLTLAFLDEQPVSALHEIHAELADIRVPPFEATVRGLGAFGGNRPRQLYADVVETPALIGLHRRVRSACRAAGIDLPRARFHPHVTLARFSAAEAASGQAAIDWVLRTGAGFDAGVFDVTDFALFSSQLGPDGPSYEVLARYPLSFNVIPHEGVWAPEDH
jgi:2'-5' RNA ligase